MKVCDNKPFAVKRSSTVSFLILMQQQILQKLIKDLKHCLRYEKVDRICFSNLSKKTLS